MRSSLVSVDALVNRICRNIGVLQTTVAELITVEKHQRKFASSRSCTDGKLICDSARLFHHAFCLVPWVSLILWAHVSYATDRYFVVPSSAASSAVFLLAQPKRGPMSSRAPSLIRIRTFFRTCSVPPWSYLDLQWAYCFWKRRMKTESTTGIAGARRGNISCANFGGETQMHHSTTRMHPLTR